MWEHPGLATAPTCPAPRHSPRTSFSWMSFSLFRDSMKLSMAPRPWPRPSVRRCRMPSALLPLCFWPVGQEVGEELFGWGRACGCKVLSWATAWRGSRCWSRGCGGVSYQWDPSGHAHTEDPVGSPTLSCS